jgi:hypothetical protein
MKSVSHAEESGNILFGVVRIAAGLHGTPGKGLGSNNPQFLFCGLCAYQLPQSTGQAQSSAEFAQRVTGLSSGIRILHQIRNRSAHSDPADTVMLTQIRLSSSLGIK